MTGKIKAFFRRLLRRPAKVAHEPILAQHKAAPEETVGTQTVKEEFLLFDRPIVVRQPVRDVAKDIETMLIAKKNLERRQSTLGYGLPTRGFKPRSAHEKKLFKLEKKPDEND